MNYEAWRISYQDSEQAARAAYAQWKEWHAQSQNNANEAEKWRMVAERLAVAVNLVLMRAKEQPSPFRLLIDGGSLQEALVFYNAVTKELRQDENEGQCQVSHDYPACAIFRGGKCSCDAYDAPNGR